MTPPGATPYTQLYLVGSSGDDDGHRDLLRRLASPSTSPGGTFDESAADAGGCDVERRRKRSARWPTPLDSLLARRDERRRHAQRQRASRPRSPWSTLGGEGERLRSPAATKARTCSSTARTTAPTCSHALGGDDALLHNGGADELLGGDGNDLFLSVSICDGDRIDGGGGRDNSSWARFKGGGVYANLGTRCRRASGGGGGARLRRRTDRLAAGSRGPGGIRTALTFSTATAAPTSCSATSAPTPTSPAPATTRSWRTPATPTGDRLRGRRRQGHDRPPRVRRPDADRMRERARSRSEQLSRPHPAAAPALAGTPSAPAAGGHPPASHPPRRTPARSPLHPGAVAPRCLPLHRERAGQLPLQARRAPLPRLRLSPRLPGQGRPHAFRIVAIDAAGNADPTPALFRFGVRRR